MWLPQTRSPAVEKEVAEGPRRTGAWSSKKGKKESTVRKKMAAVHFTTMPCEPNTAHKAQKKAKFKNICRCTKDTV